MKVQAFTSSIHLAGVGRVKPSNSEQAACDVVEVEVLPVSDVETSTRRRPEVCGQQPHEAAGAVELLDFVKRDGLGVVEAGFDDGAPAVKRPGGEAVTVG